MCATTQSFIEPQPGQALRGCGSIVFGGVASLPLAAWRAPKKTGGSRRRHRAVVPVGTKTVVELIGSGLIAS